MKKEIARILKEEIALYRKDVPTGLFKNAQFKRGFLAGMAQAKKIILSIKKCEGGVGGSPALISCPFCGELPMSKPQFHKKNKPDQSYWTIVCLNCECEGPKWLTKDRAILHWNTRAQD